ncbi:hypothetical protein K466DRAFT_592262 [Polyporus arcularius HHB13444]|uniref:Uncharacterized protein n=1 Tax=Polyporus arcularius HHB13444 TaxID=1314778 RepID=A0A5C3NQU8_9APHY|nr:hypothetical protein K466DRAFT_592262 [Polyporus arcularius HHB13444]
MPSHEFELQATLDSHTSPPPLLRCSPYMLLPYDLLAVQTTHSARSLSLSPRRASRTHTAKASTTCVAPSPGSAPQDNDARSSVRGGAETSRSARSTEG